MQAPRELDLKGRGEYYGTSELGAMLNLDPFQDLDMIYKRKILGVVVPPTKQMLQGKIFEEAIFTVTCMETGKKFRPSFNVTYRHPEFPKYHLVATPDGLPPEGEENEGGVECKDFSPWRLDELTAEELPPHIELQARGCMAVLNRPRWYVAVWCRGKLWVFVVERDMEFEVFFLEHSEEIWQRHFVAKVPPPIGGSKMTADWLQSKYPKHRRPDLRQATLEEIEQLRRYGKLKIEQKVLAKERAVLENWLKDAIQDREGLIWDGGRFTWRSTKDSHITNWEGLAQTLMTRHVRLKDGSARDEEACLKLVEDHSFIRPGTRRVWFKSDEFFESEGNGREEEEVNDAA